VRVKRKHARAYGEAVENEANGADSRGSADRAGADAAPVSHETPVLELLRVGAGDA
jgi:hypothetical protein